jgi:uncharacterized membrane protein YfcA
MPLPSPAATGARNKRLLTWVGACLALPCLIYFFVLDPSLELPPDLLLMAGLIVVWSVSAFWLYRYFKNNIH